jgi:hypothetical protein
MNKYKEKHLTPYQRIRFKLKQEVKKKQTFLRKLKVIWYRRQLEAIRENQFIVRQ